MSGEDETLGPRPTDRDGGSPPTDPRDGTSTSDDGPTEGGLRGSLRRTARIARWEVSRSTGTVDRKTVLIVLVMVAVVGVVGLSVTEEGLGLEDELYVVAVDEDDPYFDVAAESEPFRPIPLVDLEVEGDGADANADVVVTPQGEIGYVGPNGEAAYDAFRDAVDAYNEARMAEERDEAAAYPVLVTLEYRDRGPAAFGGESGSGEVTAGDGRSVDDDGSGGESGADGDSRAADDGSGGESGATDGTADADGAVGGDGETGGDGTIETDGSRADGGASADAGDDRLRVPNVGGGTAGGTTAPGSPSTLSPPFPFGSLVLAFLLVVPMNFVIQAYGSSIVDERIKRRGELLLVSPAGRSEIVAGKTLPYLLGLLAVTLGITYVIDGGFLTVAATVPIAFAFLSATFAGAMFARSFKELTFVTVTISVVLTTYAFVPAIFTDVTPIALISPLTLVVLDLQGESVRVAEYLFSTGPFYLGSAVCFLLGIGVYREEDMFTQKPIPAKVLDAIVSRIDAIAGRWRATAAPAVLSVLALPFVFAAQLLAVALLFAVPESVALPAMVVLAAAVEEFAKSVHVYAGFARSRYRSTPRVGAILGAVSGAGFFLGEKLTHFVQFVGIPDLTVGAAAFGPALSGDPLVVVAVLFAPLVLHVVTAATAAVGAARGRRAYALAFLLATGIHAAYNVGVIWLVA